MEIKYTRIIQITFFYILGIVAQLVFHFSLIYILILLTFPAVFLYFKKLYYFIFFLSFLLGSGNTLFVINNNYVLDTGSFYNKKHLISGKIINYPVMSKMFYLLSSERGILLISDYYGGGTYPNKVNNHRPRRTGQFCKY